MPKKKALARAADREMCRIWVVGEDGRPTEALSEPMSRARAIALARAVGGAVEVRPAAFAGVVPARAREAAMRALRAAAKIHAVMRPHYRAGEGAPVALDSLSRALVGHLAESPKVRRAVDGLMDLFSDFTNPKGDTK